MCQHYLEVEIIEMNQEQIESIYKDLGFSYHDHEAVTNFVVSMINKNRISHGASSFRVEEFQTWSCMTRYNCLGVWLWSPVSAPFAVRDPMYLKVRALFQAERRRMILMVDKK